MVEDAADHDTLGLEPAAVLVELLRRYREGDVVHGSDGAGEFTLVRAALGRGDTRCGVGGIGEPEEGDGVPSPPAVEEEVLAESVGQVECLDERHAQHAGVEVDGASHVGAHEREVVDSAEVEFRIRGIHCGPFRREGEERCAESAPEN